ncbi:MAG: alpha/beta fold hydrolase [Cohaesibacteraceae bacterium]
MPAKLHRVGGEGPPVLLIHGFGADRMGWVANTPALMERHSVWAIDLPGHGEAEPEPSSPADIARDIAYRVSKLDGPLALIGHSLGGAISAQMVADDPGRYGAVVLLAPAAFGSGPPDASFLEGFARLETEEEALALLGRLVERKRLIQPPMAQYVLAHLAKPGRREALAEIGKAAMSFVRPPLPENALVIWGEKDSINRPDPVLFEQLGDRAVLLPDTGHLPQVEAATRVNRLILDHLSAD